MPIAKLLTDDKLILLDSLKRPIIGQGSINITVKRYFTDVSGELMDKLSAPAVLQKDYPVYVLSNFDRTGAYNISQKTIPPAAGVYFVGTYAHGFGLPFLLFTGLNDLQSKLKFGDIVNIYTDSLTAPTAFCFIVQSASQGGLASLIANTQTIQDDGRIGQIYIKNISYNVDAYQQWDFDWRIVRIDNTGAAETQVINLIKYRSPDYKLTDYIVIPVEFMATQYVGVCFGMSFNCDLINLNIRIAR